MSDFKLVKLIEPISINVNGNDASAIHDDAANEIAAIVNKAAPVANDYFLIEDSAAANVKKSITLGSINHNLLFNYDALRHKLHPGTTILNSIPKHSNVSGDLTTSTVTISSLSEIAGATKIDLISVPVITSAPSNHGMIYMSGTTNYTYNAAIGLPAIDYNVINTFSANPNILGSGFLLWNKGTFQDISPSGTLGPAYSLVAQAQLLSNSSGAKTQLFHYDLLLRPTWKTTGTGTLTCGSAVGVLSGGSVDSDATVTSWSAFYAQGVSSANTRGTTPGVITSQAGLVTNLNAAATNSTDVLLGTPTIPAGRYGLYQATRRVFRRQGAQIDRIDDTAANINLSTGTSFEQYHTINTTVGSPTHTLPAGSASINGLEYVFVNSGGGIVTINRNGSNIDGIAANFTLNPGKFVTLKYSNSSNNWVIISLRV